MKKQVILIISLIVLVLPFVVKAQDFRAGLQFGITPSQVDGDGISGYNKIGLRAGAFVERDINDKVFFFTDLSFTMKGSRVASSKNVNFDQVELTTNYIDWGLYAGYRFSEKIDFKAGLIPSVLIYDKETTAGGIEILGENPFRAVNLLISGGVNYSFSKHFSVDATYNYSIISIRPGEYEIFNYDVKISNAQYHHYINLSLMYHF
jgi:hypothetical protein